MRFLVSQIFTAGGKKLCLYSRVASLPFATTTNAQIEKYPHAMCRKINLSFEFQSLSEVGQQKVGLSIYLCVQRYQKATQNRI